jgi:Rha family phage regulatory protein
LKSSTIAAVTTSLAVAEYFDKRHDQVLESIRNARSQVSDFFRDQNFLESKYTPNGQMRSYPMYYLTKNGFVFLVMGFTGEEAARIKEAYITAFDRMEKLLREHADLSQQNSFL